jgi:hypothetical protein
MSGKQFLSFCSHCLPLPGLLSADSAVFLPFVPGTKILPEITNALLTEQSMPVYTFSILTYLQMILTPTSFYAARPKNISVVFREKMIL